MTVRAQPHGAVAILDRELRDLRHRLGEIPRGRGRRVPAALRERIVAWIATRRAHGDEWRELARALGMPAQTLTRWAARDVGHERSVVLRPVAVIDELASRTVTVVAPSGLRVEGVTIADAIAILRSLA
jgi:transposase-like protein